MCTWFVRAKARLAAKSWKDVLDSRKSCQEECLGVASVITFACSHIDGPDSITSVEGYVHSDENIQLGSLRRWLPINHSELPELVDISFEAILPGRNEQDQQYTKHPTILKFLAETTTTPSDTSKRLRVDFCGSSGEPEDANLERGKTWFLRARVRVSAGWNFADVLKDHEDRQATRLRAASYIAFACSPDSDHPGTAQVELLVRAKRGRCFLRKTVLEWLADSVEVEHLEAEPIRTANNKPFTSHETVMRFYAETAREEPLNGKGRLEVFLGASEDVVGKPGRRKGSTKAARTAAVAQAAAVLPSAAAEGRVSAVPPTAAAGGRAGAVPPAAASDAGGSSGAGAPGGPWSGGGGRSSGGAQGKQGRCAGCGAGGPFGADPRLGAASEPEAVGSSGATSSPGGGAGRGHGDLACPTVLTHQGQADDAV